MKTLAIGTAEFPCADIEFLGPEVLLVRREQCDAARGEALLLDPTTYETRAQVGPRCPMVTTTRLRSASKSPRT